MFKTIKSLTRNAIISYFNHRFEKESLQMLFIYGHMRSGSSLLVHILNTNPEILGYGETHSMYYDKSDFGKVSLKIYRAFKTIPVKEKYILDKILHSYLIKDIDILKHTKIIFLLRCPSESLSSIHNLRPQKYTPQVTSEYYNKRLERIRFTARTLNPEKWIYITYHDLINAVDKTFCRLENFLSLKTELSEEYDTMWSTGKSGIGDPSKKIQEGEIVQKNSSKKIPPTLQPYIENSRQTYQACLAELKKIKGA